MRVLNLQALGDFWKWNPLTSVHIHKFPLAIVPNINNPISICACRSLALKQWHLNITRIIIKRHQLAQGEVSVDRSPASRVMAKNIGEIKPLLDPWVPYNDVISLVENGLERTCHASRGDDVAPINEFLHHFIFQIWARITGSFPACSLHGEDDRTMAEERVKG